MKNQPGTVKNKQTLHHNIEHSVLSLVSPKRHTQMRHDSELMEGCSLLTFKIENQHLVTKLNVLLQSSDLEID